MMEGLEEIGFGGGVEWVPKGRTEGWWCHGEVKERGEGGGPWGRVRVAEGVKDELKVSEGASGGMFGFDVTVETRLGEVDGVEGVAVKARE
jgi:hypothetical protein